MPPRKPSRSLLFCEWAAGTTIPRALGPLPPKKKESPRRRGVVKVEVTTDDESEEDSVKITYPRTQSPVPTEKTLESVVKKVRFEESALKPALKKPAEPAEKPKPPEADSDSDASSSAASTPPPSPPPKKGKEKEKKKKQKPAPVAADSDTADEASSAPASDSSASDSDASASTDSKPHPTCECTKCVRGRQEAKKTEKCKKLAKPKKKQESSGSEPETGDEKSASEPESDAAKESSASEGEPEAETKKKSEPAEKKKAENGKKKQEQDGKTKAAKKADSGNKKAKADKAEKTEEKKSDEPPKEEEKKEEPKEPSKPEKTDVGNQQKAASYPQPYHPPTAFPGPHPRRPQLIEPIRAEVVQTERVVESVEDPPPNAFYDPEHKVIRVYHGPVYGNHQNRSLYPRRDPLQRPLPIGMPHPTQNPYYYGFAQASPPPLGENQYAPVGAWNGQWNQHPGPGGYAQNMPPAVNQADATAKPDQGPNDMSGANVDGAPPPPPSNKPSDQAAGNNVGPIPVTSIHDNPYIPKRARSQFSGFGSHRSGSQRGGRGDGGSQGNQGSNNGASNHQGQDNNNWQSTWDNSNPNPPSNNDWGQPPPSNGWNDQGNGQQTGDWGTQENAQTGDWGGSNNVNDPAPASEWQETTEHNNNTDWGADATANDNNTTSQDGYNRGAFAGYSTSVWRSTGADKPPSSPRVVDNNVAPPMPGGWKDDNSAQQSWADPTLAVDTGGKSDFW
ncbi:hypothetical protein B0I35DRAFT_508593 [Stachybotrys elegans]|uniref:Uncharacterized protein n=1 Tax=Stachybotrys elegans TaxID=80388 RepID=A0A8K0WWZ0_9HYPO|nr:hypothetical protein B0I35DRAFT_508593 [Stachybotrys elegans]